ncbi:hypothetical protein KFL_000320295 [Klebsormidium nitens]|uniref:Uncharacterized protein n=1 Tax=Klebsormidium nitens TaxID=105231 RepID=A0A1Y1HRB2_KLENI|nr:hypothetical protein KFL_000320295 [Klebsormidium nitens]|eukprot:GAQ79531.1 hypothetical protein KFL_000320295 [Klebsormidium nitens]
MVSAPLASLLAAGFVLIALSPQIPPGADQLCGQAGLFGQFMCVMNTGTGANRTYSSQVLLSARQLADNTTAVDRIFGAEPFLRPDMVITAEGTRATFLSASKGLATVYLDFFICSEETCSSVADLKYFQDTEGERGVGFPIGVVPLTNLAVGLPVGQGALGDAVNVSVDLTSERLSQGITSAVRSYQLQGSLPIKQRPLVAMAGTRVTLDILADFLLSEPGVGVANRAVQGACTLLIFPDSPWYRQYILPSFPLCVTPTQTLALLGLDDGNWCQLCDGFSISVVNYQAGCYLSNRGTCGFLDYPLVNPEVGGWTLNMYNLTSPADGQTLYSGDQGTYTHPWTGLLYNIRAEGRAAAPAGCNHTGRYTCVGDGCSTKKPFLMTCPAATRTGGLSGGFGALLSTAEYSWASSTSSSLGSFFGYERLSVNGLGKVVSAAEDWGFAIASNVVKDTVIYYDQVLSTTGLVTTWLTTLIAVVGSWAAYPQISAWISRAIGSARGWEGFLGKALAGVTTIVATSAPLVIVIATQHSLSVNNGRRVQHMYYQAAYDAPGPGH